MIRQLALVVAGALASCVPVQGGTHIPEWIADTSSYGTPPVARPPTAFDVYREVATRIITAARADRAAYTRLAQLTDGIGARQAGSSALDGAIAWAAQAMKDDGFAVRTEKVRGPHSVRGAEDVALVAPLARPLSANVIGEFRGTEKPDEIVVLGAHLDAWDVGQGAHDGAGCVTMMQAIRLLEELGLAPKRTIRVVLFIDEEPGLRGAKAYAAEHAAELPNTVFAVEIDAGGFAPRTFGIQTQPSVEPRTVARMTELIGLLAPLGVTKIHPGQSGAHVGQLVAGGVPAAELYTDGRTEADTFDKIDPAQLADAVAAIAVLAHVIADLPDRIDAP